jgi:stalled ribosome rescue protein Dom34
VVVTVNAPPPATPPGGGGGGTDTTPPAGTLAGKAKQDVDKLKLTVGSNEVATASGQATVNAAGAKKPVTSKTATATISANGTAELKFKFKKKTLKKIKKQLEQGKKPKAAIAVTFTDTAGNAATANKTIKLKD